jgi:hypothetical protein
MKMNLDWMPRFVLPDSRVFMPDEIFLIEVTEGTFWSKIARAYSLKDARIDRQSPFTDKKGKRLFENDKVKHEGVIWILHYDEDGDWLMSSGGLGLDADNNWVHLTEYAGFVPYGGEK